MQLLLLGFPDRKLGRNAVEVFPLENHALALDPKQQLKILVFDHYLYPKLSSRVP